MKNLKLFLPGLLLLSTPLYARLYNYQDSPIGERSFGMGSTAVAVTGDVSNSYYNPAVLAYDEKNQVSGSLSSYERIDTRTGEYVSLFQSAHDNISRGGFVATPSMVGGHLKSGPWVWGGSILVPNSFINSGTVDLPDGSIASFEGNLNSVWMGPFLSRRFGDYALGVAIFYASTTSDEKFYFVESPNVRFVETNYYINGVVAVIGGTWDLNDKVRLGLSYRTPPWRFGGTGEFSDSAQNINKQSSSSVFYPLPMRLSLGVNWEMAPQWTFAADCHIYSSAIGNITGSSNAAFAVNANAVSNFSLGAEYRAWKDMGFRMGFFTNLSSAIQLPNALTAINDKVHMFGGTASIVFSQASGSLSIGGYAQGGQGTSSALDGSTNSDVPRSDYVYGFVVASTYHF